MIFKCSAHSAEFSLLTPTSLNGNLIQNAMVCVELIGSVPEIFYHNHKQI